MNKPKRKRFTFSLNHCSRLTRLRDIEASSREQKTIRIVDTNEDDEIPENVITPVESLYSKFVDDIGYFTFYDEFNHRNIVVAHRKLGQNAAFLREHNIRHCMDLICTRDDSFFMLTSRQKEINYGFVKAAVLLIADAPGNICIYCVMGRSRSPAFIAAYLVVVGCYSPAEAYSALSKIFVLNRIDERGIDRDRRFWPYVVRLESEVSSLAW